ncbi:uncharacterized protein LOC8280609 isoform X1 [Ricinus communis]|uniref:uncharacterized protein LOC8280609 isoform X1 n=1 Tax=Ricinus communis TaxID=3988 RepID=UPI00201AE8CE|nr:uncharacterized protein LOC8280609 isoform X1 [Ricinus communis]
MDQKQVESERALNGREHGDEYIHKTFIAAGTTLAMACLKRILVMFFVEQWRTRVFLILNLVLLTILFTSIRSSSSENDQESKDTPEMKTQENKKRNECGLSTKDKPHQESHKLCKRTKDAHEVEQEHIKVDIEAQKLSQEELNERAEAFIAMFRQHLVSDARKSRNQFISRSKQSEMFNLRKESNLTISSERLQSNVGMKV